MSYGIDLDDVIVVGVDTSTKTGSTYLTDSPTSGQWDTFFTKDLIPFVDSHYRTLPQRQARPWSATRPAGSMRSRMGSATPTSSA